MLSSQVPLSPEVEDKQKKCHCLACCYIEASKDTLKKELHKNKKLFEEKERAICTYSPRDFKKSEALGVYRSQFAMVDADSSPYPIIGSFGAETCVIVALYDPKRKRALVAHLYSLKELEYLPFFLAQMRADARDMVAHLRGGDEEVESSQLLCLAVENFLKESGITLASRALMPPASEKEYNQTGFAIDTRTGKIYGSKDLYNKVHFTQDDTYINAMVTLDQAYYCDLRDGLLKTLETYSTPPEYKSNPRYREINKSIKYLRYSILILNEQERLPHLVDKLYNIFEEEAKSMLVKTSPCFFSKDNQYSLIILFTLKNWIESIKKTHPEFSSDSLTERQIPPLFCERPIKAEIDFELHESQIEKLYKFGDKWTRREQREQNSSFSPKVKRVDVDLSEPHSRAYGSFRNK